MTQVFERLQEAMAGDYRVERELGRGGMATVYLAYDVKHDRQVAVKVLHPELTAVLGPERFLQEIRIAAKLNHPHILPVHDSGRADAFLYYVMPYIEGESLRAKLTRERQLAIGDAVGIARQVASALDYAHRHDIVHRDIKPENILLQDGEAMVADFGIALAVHVAGGERLTETGLSLGTPEYMSPEQASGDRALDGRSDIYSLGSVLYEMLAGEAPYTGTTVQAIVAKVLTERPYGLRSRRDTVPKDVEAATMRALAKLPADRFVTAAEFADTLGRFVGSGTQAMDTAALRTERRMRSLRSVQRWTRRNGAWVIAGVAVVLAAWAWVRPSSSTSRVTRLTVTLPPSQQLVGGPSPPIAVSPDGSQLVYAAQRDGDVQLYLRSLDSFRAQAMSGTDGAIAPFFSPDGAWVGFFADGELKKVPVGGGSPLTVTAAPWSASFGFAASWSETGTIVFAPGLQYGLLQVPEGGGETDQLTIPNAEEGEVGHGWPQVLPGGDEVLFSVVRRDGRQVDVMSLETRDRRTVFRREPDATGARLLPTGHIVYAQGGTLLGLYLSGRRTSTAGSPLAVVDGVFGFGSGLAYLTVSQTGTLIYAPGGVVAAQNALVLVDREGNETALGMEAGVYLYPRFSPDGRRIAVNVDDGGNRDVLVFDLTRGTRTRVTVEGGNSDPVWSPDGRDILFASNRAGAFNLYAKSSDGSGSARLLLGKERSQFPHSWSPDGHAIAFYELDPTRARDIWILEMKDDTTATELLATPFNERSPTFSPDGRWLAYVSNESGRDEVYVLPYPAGQGRVLISADGGKEPAWAADGRSLFYRNGDQLMEVTIRAEPTFQAGQPSLLFEGRYDAPAMSSGSIDYDVSPDGRYFVMVRRDDEVVPRELHVVLNWFQEVQELLPKK